MVENGSLRESLASMQRELVSLLNQRQARRQEPSVSPADYLHVSV